MGYVVLHLEKATGNDAAMSAHIERTIDPKNADKSRSYLNKELIDLPEGVRNRTEAIQHRIDNADIKRKIGKNQVQAIRIMLSATPEDMKDIEEFGNLKPWCKDNVEWLQDTFGKENLVSAVLHMDEKTPHIHATVVPIVQGERRKAKTEQDNGKKKYKKKTGNVVRLCADDVMARDKLKSYQDSYAEKMKPYGLNRGISGSEAKHISTQEFYRELHLKNEDLKESIESQTYRIEDAQQKIHDMYEYRDKAKNEFFELDNQIKQKEQTLQQTDSRLRELQKAYEPYQAQEDLNLIHKLFPMMKEQLRIAKLCEKIGLGIKYIVMMFEGKSLTAASYSFFSPEHNRQFEATNVNIKIEKDAEDQSKLKLTLNGKDILDWFRIKYKELQERIKPNPSQSRGFKM